LKQYLVFTNNICGRKQELTLDDIENVILRDLFFDPAIHFALSSAAKWSSTFEYCLFARYN
jgi:hypothetical protein